MFQRTLMIALVASLSLALGCPNKSPDTNAAAQAEPTKAEGEAPETDDNAQDDEAAAAAKQKEDETNSESSDKETTMHPALLDPSKATETAPNTYKVKFETTAGDFTVKVNRAWAPNGADRFYNLVKIGYYDDGIALFRVIDGFMAQFGIHGNPEVNTKWREARIDDDPVKESNTRGKLTFATAGPNTRTTQLFINFGNNASLDGQGFAPFGEVIDGGMDTVDNFHKGYGEGAPRGRGPNQGLVQQKGNEYLKKDFPELDYIEKATIVE